MSYVLDASALLALLHGEARGRRGRGGGRGVGDLSRQSGPRCRRFLRRGIDTEGLGPDVQALGVRTEPFLAEDAEVAAGFWPAGRRLGLSLGDRACLALAGRLGATALTADRAWARLELGVEVRTIR